jgi:phosphate transport system substrate-binding protein
MKYISAFLLLGMFLTSCGSSDSELSGEIKIDGSSTVYPISEAVAEEFRTEAPDVRTTVGLSGTGGGFQKFLRGETDINNASREISQDEVKKAEEAGIDFIQLSVAYDGLAVVVNPENDWVDYFTVEELKKIWEPDAQNKIEKWSDIRPEWPDENMELFGPGVASGTYDYFTEAIVGESGASRGDFTASEDDNVLVQGVSSDKNALGFFGLAYFEENRDKLRLVGIENPTGEVVEPTIETVSNNAYAPLSRPLFIYVNEDAVQRENVQKFVKFYLDNAGQLAEEIGYVSMPASAYEKEKEKFNAFISEVTATDTTAAE